LFRAEIGEILDHVKVIAALGGIIAGLGLLALNLLAIGGLLFLGEWLFGSLGWGVLHGVLLLAGVMTAVALLLFMAPASVIAGGVAAAVVVGAVVAALLALNVPRRAAEEAARALGGGTPSTDPASVGAVAGAVVLGLLGAIAGLRSGGGARSALGGLVGGAALGGLVGWSLGAMTFSVHGGIALGVAIGLAAWPILQLGLASRAGVDPGARFERLKPRETIETVQETRAWLEAEWAKRRDKLAKR
jgi:hypothetical protein